VCNFRKIIFGEKMTRKVLFGVLSGVGGISIALSM
jgi:hypothetical protein